MVAAGALIIGVGVGVLLSQMIENRGKIQPLTPDEKMIIEERINTPIPELTPEERAIIEKRIQGR